VDLFFFAGEFGFGSDIYVGDSPDYSKNKKMQLHPNDSYCAPLSGSCQCQAAQKMKFGISERMKVKATTPTAQICTDSTFSDSTPYNTGDRACYCASDGNSNTVFNRHVLVNEVGRYLRVQNNSIKALALKMHGLYAMISCDYNMIEGSPATIK